MPRWTKLLEKVGIKEALSDAAKAMEERMLKHQESGELYKAGQDGHLMSPDEASSTWLDHLPVSTKNKLAESAQSDHHVMDAIYNKYFDYGVPENHLSPLLPKDFHSLENVEHYQPGILDRITSPEQAAALKGPEKEEYLKALDEAYGPRETRAEDMGFDRKKWYHGSPNEIEEFASGKDLGKKSGNGNSHQIFLTDQKDTAKMYGKPIEVRTNREPHMADQPGYSDDVSEAYEELANKDGVNLRLKNHDGEMSKERWLMLPDGQGLRRTDAAFDPRFKDSKKLLAGAAGAAVLGGAAVGSDDAQAGPLDKARWLADQYAKYKGLNKLAHNAPTAAVNVERAQKIAQAYEALRHDPFNPEVQQAYNSLINETGDQLSVLKDLGGLKTSKITPEMGNPYKDSKAMIQDVTDNNHLYYYPTEQGFGTTEGSGAAHPLLQPIKVGNETMPANDAFRIVHDYFGHAKEGSGFGPKGEENAWREHMPMFTPEAQKALTTETRGQNSWVNFGPKGAANRANPASTIYADQKAAILPEWARKMDPKTAAALMAGGGAAATMAPDDAEAAGVQTIMQKLGVGLEKAKNIKDAATKIVPTGVHDTSMRAVQDVSGLFKEPDKYMKLGNGEDYVAHIAPSGRIVKEPIHPERGSIEDVVSPAMMDSVGMGVNTKTVNVGNGLYYVQDGVTPLSKVTENASRRGGDPKLERLYRELDAAHNSNYDSIENTLKPGEKVSAQQLHKRASEAAKVNSRILEAQDAVNARINELYKEQGVDPAAIKTRYDALGKQSQGRLAYPDNGGTAVDTGTVKGNYDIETAHRKIMEEEARAKMNGAIDPYDLHEHNIGLNADKQTVAFDTSRFRGFNANKLTPEMKKAIEDSFISKPESRALLKEKLEGVETTRDGGKIRRVNTDEMSGYGGSDPANTSGYGGGSTGAALGGAALAGGAMAGRNAQATEKDITPLPAIEKMLSTYRAGLKKASDWTADTFAEPVINTVTPEGLPGRDKFIKDNVGYASTGIELGADPMNYVPGLPEGLMAYDLLKPKDPEPELPEPDPLDLQRH